MTRHSRQPGGPPGPPAPAAVGGEPPPVVLEVIGLLCPLPILLAERSLIDRPPGTRLTLVGDDPGILEDVPAWCAGAGHTVLEMVREQDGTIRAVVVRGG